MTHAWSIIVLLVAVTTLPAVAQTAPAPTPPETTQADAADPAPAEEQEAAPAPTGPEQQKSLRMILETFVPSEEIDADKPVDFPTNI